MDLGKKFFPYMGNIKRFYTTHHTVRECSYEGRKSRKTHVEKSKEKQQIIPLRKA